MPHIDRPEEAEVGWLGYRFRRSIADPAVPADVSERTTVWYLIGELRVGGTERTLVDLLDGLDRDEVAPSVWTIADQGPLASEVPDDVPVRSLGAESKLDGRAPLRLVRALRVKRPDVLQSFLFFDNVLARLTGFVSPETTVVTGVRAVPNSMPLHRDIVDRLTMPLSDQIVSNSEAGAEWVIDRGADPAMVDVIYNGRDVERYDVPVPDSLRETLGIPDGPVVGTVGRLIERKGHHDLLDAWPGVQEVYPDGQLVIVGDGPEREALEAHAERLGVAASVHLLGRRDDVPELLALFDIFAFPSHYEGLPGALLEAMCAGLPIVTTSVDGCAELIVDGEHGLHVPPKNEEALAEAIVELLENGPEATELGQKAAIRARDKFSTGAMVDEFEGLYRSVG